MKINKTNINSTHNLAKINGKAIGFSIVSQKSKLKEQKSKTKNQKNKKKQTESLTEVKSLEHKMNENHCKYQWSCQKGRFWGGNIYMYIYIYAHQEVKHVSAMEKTSN